MKVAILQWSISHHASIADTKRCLVQDNSCSILNESCSGVMDGHKIEIVIQSYFKFITLLFMYLYPLLV